MKRRSILVSFALSAAALGQGTIRAELEGYSGSDMVFVTPGSVIYIDWKPGFPLAPNPFFGLRAITFQPTIRGIREDDVIGRISREGVSPTGELSGRVNPFAAPPMNDTDPPMSGSLTLFNDGGNVRRLAGANAGRPTDRVFVERGVAIGQNVPIGSDDPDPPVTRICITLSSVAQQRTIVADAPFAYILGSQLSYYTSPAGDFQTVTLLPENIRPLTIHVVPCRRSSCPADVDDGSDQGIPDDAVTIDDLLHFLRLYADGTPCADMDNGSGTGRLDGGVTIDDLLYYLVRYAAGC